MVRKEGQKKKKTPSKIFIYLFINLFSTTMIRHVLNTLRDTVTSSLDLYYSNINNNNNNTSPYGSGFGAGTVPETDWQS